MGFKHRVHVQISQVSRYICHSKHIVTIANIIWRIMRKVYRKSVSNFSKLCVTERFFLNKSLSDDGILNNKSELARTSSKKNKT